MKNPNDSYWTSGSDVRIPEYDQPPDVYGKNPAMTALEALKERNAILADELVTSAERKVILDRRFSGSLWRIWWPFERRERQKFVEESRDRP